MSERLAELTDLWTRHFEGALAPAEEARLESLLGDAVLVEEFSQAQALRAGNEPQASLSEESWKRLDDGLTRALRARKAARLLRPLATICGAAILAAGAFLWFGEKEEGLHGDLRVDGGSFSMQEPIKKAPKPVPEPRGQHEIHSAKVSFVVSQKQGSRAVVKIFDSKRSLIRTLSTGQAKPGSYRIGWDGLDGQGLAVHPGTYHIEIADSAGTQTRELEIRQKP